MESITSLRNPYIKEARTLKNKKGRELFKKYLVEGEKCAREAVLYADVESVLTSSDLDFPQCRVIKVTDEIISALSLAKTPQSVIAVVKNGPEKSMPNKGIIVALDSLGDPRNVGAIIRTADAIDAAGVILSPDTADYMSQAAVRASMGSCFHLPIIRRDIRAAVLELKSSGFSVLGGHIGGEGRLPLNKNIVVVIGNEARGASPEILDICDELYSIKIYGKAESLNAAVAAGIILYRIKEGI